MKNLGGYLIPGVFRYKLTSIFKSGYMWIDELYDDILKNMPNDIEENGQEEYMNFEVMDDEFLIWITGFVWEYDKERQSAGSISVTWGKGGKFKSLEFDGLDLDDDSVKGKVIL